MNVFAPDGLVARKVSGNWRYYQFDPQGSVTHRLTSDETVTNSSMYNAYGQHVTVPFAVSDPFGYNGRWGYYTDSSTGLILCTFRYYDPAQGRWLNRDPIGYEGGISIYAYCAGKPVQYADPKGLASAFGVWFVGKGVGIITIAVDNRGIGHAWIELHYFDRRGTWYVENGLQTGTVAGKELADPSHTTGASKSQLFNAFEFPTPASMMGKIKPYRLTRYNCVHFATDVWERVTGEPIKLDWYTGGQLEIWLTKPQGMRK